jgi:exodeoxyribonuclease V alpha subunit
MAIHITARLVWHDNAWDGCVCQNPVANTSCIVHQHIREGRNDVKEQTSRGLPLLQLVDELPPCSRDSGAYSTRPYKAVHSDPLEFRRLPAVTEDVPPFSCCPSPYRWMREENFQNICEAENLRIRQPEDPRNNGWVMEADRQKFLLTEFWGKLEKGTSLIFYYCKDGHPFDSAASRILVGIGRLSEVGSQLYFGTTTKHPEPFPIWSRRITQDYPQQGLRLPYQEYLRLGIPADKILCEIPQAALPDFSFVGEHVSDDSALAVVERCIRSVEQVHLEAKVPGDWSQRLVWLNDVLAELWRGRGPFPGMGSVLQFLGCQTGTAFQRAALAPMAKRGENPWGYVHGILEGTTPVPVGPHSDDLKKAQVKWKKLPSRHELLSQLVKFELTPDQVARIADPTERAQSAIAATEKELVANPYLICETDQGTDSSDPISLDTIDHGMLPSGDAAMFVETTVDSDDQRRVRAVACDVLATAAGEGDTVLSASELFERIRKRFSDKRVCRIDLEIFQADLAFYESCLWTALDIDPRLVSLKALRDLESYTADLMLQRASKKVSKTATEPDWVAALTKRFGAPATDRERSAFDEKQVALRTLFGQKLSILTGGAGTGKTSVLQVFIEELERAEGKQTLLLLAPTGKARVRLATKTKRNAMTIHQFLLKQDWIKKLTFALKPAGGMQFAATTVIVDESSMIPVDLFGTLLKALNTGPLKRLILVGDPNQLPPIGPGRPFVDIVNWVADKHPDTRARLMTCMRVTENGKADSVGLSLADGYRADAVHPADDEVLAAISRGEPLGDLECHFWSDPADLMKKLGDRLAKLMGIAPKDYKSFNASLGIDDKNGDYTKSEAWQILCPTRVDLHGTEELNRIIQAEYRGGILTNSRTRRGNFPRPFGDREIVWCDKVIQIRNRKGKAWPTASTNLDYIANGEIGVVKTVKRDSDGDYFDIVYSTQPSVSYRYFRNQANEDLELAYALTVHKAQGSDFDVVFLIIPQAATTLTREMIYTGLTRFRTRLVLMIEKDVTPLLTLRNPAASDTERRNTQMFKLAIRPDDLGAFHPEGLIHRTKKGIAVRSKSEVIVADTLQGLGISYEYEQLLSTPGDARNFRLPDFTVSHQGDVFFWEHLGMLNVPAYRDSWEKKLAWYKASGFFDQLIMSEDAPNGGIDASEIERIARARILGE